jgi:radical SAM superfamily enzyme YgiQ (UPF0313 family)
MGLALPLAYLEEAGYLPAALDLSRETLDSARVRNALLIALSVPMHTALRLGVRAAERIRRENPQAHLCFFGHYASLNAGELLGSWADSVLAGECEESLVDLARALESGGDPGAVAGLALPGRGAAPLLRRQRFVEPNRRPLRPLSEYVALETSEGLTPAGYVEASRGCLHLCRHCPIPPVYGGRFFVVPQEMVLQDIGRQVALGAGHITFGDPDFLNGPGRSVVLAREMHRRFPALTFDFTAKIEHLLKHADRLPELKEAGCLFIVSAVESLSDRVLTILNKGHTRADVEQALRLCAEAGITLRPTLIPFTPWTSLAEYGDLLDFIAHRELEQAVDPVQLGVRLLVPPGSLLLDHPDLAPYLTGLAPGSFSHAWQHPDERMDRLHRRVAATVESAAQERESPEATLDRIREDFRECAGESPEPLAYAPRRRAGRLPRLTESWFC